MRVLRMFGMFLMATFLCVNLSSCSDDDDEEGGGNGGGVVTTAGLEGTWGLTNDQGWEGDNETKKEWNDNYDPMNPVGDDDTKMVITKTDEKTYYIKYYYFEEGEWKHLVEEDDHDMRVSVGGSVMTDLDNPEFKWHFSLNDNQLVFEYKDEQVGYYEKETYIRM